MAPKQTYAYISKYITVNITVAEETVQQIGYFPFTWLVGFVPMLPIWTLKYAPELLSIERGVTS